ncbi:hypothetical protein EB796_019270 [Bugula neritina]|uniref:G-protein coupled receptors family 1 profile domain-containing protein n=1 Tax=Bugula neritina TaxID=10212 RepID=A0A7J7J9L9_BUGNE|nr:hypothetical protein EB796_019270 [Bugula neritina]
MGDYYVLGVIPHVIECTKILSSHDNGTGTNDWLFVTNEVLYYIYPVFIGLALIFTLLNSIVTSKMATDSHECYLAAFNVLSFLLVLCSAAIHLPTYVPLEQNPYYYSLGMWQGLPYVMVLENWCLYSCTWLLAMAVIERVGHSMCGQWHASFGRLHGILASILMLVICFVCSLPQYWEYELSEVTDQYGSHNCTRMVVAPLDSVVDTTGGYISQYYYYHWVMVIFSVALPYLVLPIILPPMCCRKMHTYSALSGNGHISTYADDHITSKDYMKDEKNFNHLLGVIVMIYLVLSAPRNALRVVHNPPLFMQICENDLLADTITILSDVLFYFMFSILYLFNLCCYPKFRRALHSLRCTRCRK